MPVLQGNGSPSSAGVEPVPGSRIHRIAVFTPTMWIVETLSEPRYNGALCADMARKDTMSVELRTMKMAIRSREVAGVKLLC